MTTTLDLAAFRKLQLFIAGMQKKAEAGDWEDFANMQQIFEQVSTELPALDGLSVADSERSELVSVLVQIRTSLDFFLPLAQAHRMFLAKELAVAQNSDKLIRAYF